MFFGFIVNYKEKSIGIKGDFVGGVVFIEESVLYR